MYGIPFTALFHIISPSFLAVALIAEVPIQCSELTIVRHKVIVSDSYHASFKRS